MRPEDIREFNRQQPFEPYRIHITGGLSYDINHPDQVIVLRSRIAIGVEDEAGISERLEHVALVHVVRVEEISAESAVS